MPLIAWKSEFSVGVRQFDDQHVKLIAMINDLHEAMSKGNGDQVIGGLIDKLISYTRTHFGEEERAFQRTGYPLTDEHLAAHKTLVKQVEDLKTKHGSGKLFLTVEMSQFLKGWLTNHIMGTDKKYTSHMNANGVV